MWISISLWSNSISKIVIVGLQQQQQQRGWGHQGGQVSGQLSAPDDQDWAEASTRQHAAGGQQPRPHEGRWKVVVGLRLELEQLVELVTGCRQAQEGQVGLEAGHDEAAEQGLRARLQAQKSQLHDPDGGLEALLVTWTPHKVERMLERIGTSRKLLLCHIFKI